jgi:hypothetical protein
MDKYLYHSKRIMAAYAGVAALMVVLPPLLGDSLARQDFAARHAQHAPRPAPGESDHAGEWGRQREESSPACLVLS